MKRTKILATLGPATATREVVASLYQAGANAFRINLSHGNPEQWASLIDAVRSVSKEAPIVLDTSGPEVRLLNIPHQIRLEAGQEFIFHLHPNHHTCYTSQPLALHAGQRVLLDDGAIALQVEHVNGGVVHSRVENGGVLSERRKVSVPSRVIDLPILSEADIANVQFCLSKGADAIALSFTQRAEDVEVARSVFGDETFIIAKIENASGVQEAERIVHAADGVMIARGDLGVEIPIEEVPKVQKRLARLANSLAKPVIVATQMLESMTRSPRPTRAEVSDVANAILDGADALMLSAETATGEFPALTVQTMARVALANEPLAEAYFSRHAHGRVSVAEAISHSAAELAHSLGADAIVTATSSGFTARMVARFRPKVPVIAVTYDERTRRLLELSWGVNPVLFSEEEASCRDTILRAVKSAYALGLIAPEHLVVATAGVNTKKRGSTNLVEVHRVKELLGERPHS